MRALERELRAAVIERLRGGRELGRRRVTGRARLSEGALVRVGVTAGA